MSTQHEGSYAKFSMTLPSDSETPACAIVRCYRDNLSFIPMEGQCIMVFGSILYSAENEVYFVSGWKVIVASFSDVMYARMTSLLHIMDSMDIHTNAPVDENNDEQETLLKVSTRICALMLYSVKDRHTIRSRRVLCNTHWTFVTGRIVLALENSIF